MNAKNFTAIFFTAMAMEIGAQLLQLEWALFVIKPAVTLLLIIYFRKETVHLKKQFANAIFFGLIFSLGGDILLMFPRFNENFFLLGLVSFLIAHICYITAFTGNIRRSIVQNSFTIKALTFNPFILFTLTIYGIIKNHLGNMKLPVIAYIIAITTMGITAAMRINHTSSKSWKFILAGAFLFTVSDSMIAINKFVGAFDMARVLIMLTYYVAQYLIVKGSMMHLDWEKNNNSQ